MNIKGSDSLGAVGHRDLDGLLNGFEADGLQGGFATER